FASFLWVGIPFVMPPQPPPITKAGSLRILHAPSLPAAKGTPQIRMVIDKLHERGFEFEYIEVIGKPHGEVIRELAACDFVIDQIYSDTPMPGFATEAAFMAKPAIVGGYGLKTLDSILPADQIPPSFVCHPSELEQAVEKLIVDPEYRH